MTENRAVLRKLAGTLCRLVMDHEVVQKNHDGLPTGCIQRHDRENDGVVTAFCRTLLRAAQKAFSASNKEKLIHSLLHISGRSFRALPFSTPFLVRVRVGWKLAVSTE